MTGVNGKPRAERRTVRLSPSIDYEVTDVGKGPPVLMLHGFPSTAELWHRQVPALVDAGYRVIAPDLRGCGRSSKPTGVEHYRLPRIAGDLSLLMRHLDISRTHVVGHDWGAALAWFFTATMSHRVDHLVCLSVGHPAAFAKQSVQQRMASWYILLFAFEGVSEALLTRDEWRLAREILASGGMSDGRVDAVVERLREPGALTAALNWYRANHHPRMELERAPDLPLIPNPTMLIWGRDDIGLLEDGIVRSSDYVTGPWRYEPIDGAGHWLPVQQAERVNDLLLGFLGSHEPAEVGNRARRSF